VPHGEGSPAAPRQVAAVGAAAHRLTLVCRGNWPVAAAATGGAVVLLLCGSRRLACGGRGACRLGVPPRFAPTWSLPLVVHTSPHSLCSFILISSRAPSSGQLLSCIVLPAHHPYLKIWCAPLPHPTLLLIDCFLFPLLAWPRRTLPFPLACLHPACQPACLPAIHLPDPGLPVPPPSLPLP
jgi:hypothetical protein